MSNNYSNYTSEGFDLSAIPSSSSSTTINNNNNEEEIIYELGGTASTMPSKSNTNNTTNNNNNNNNNNENTNNNNTTNNSPIFESEQCKQIGNEYFKKKDYLNAYDKYSDAIDACPGMKGDDIMILKEEYELKEREKANQRYLRDTDRKRKKNVSSSSGNDNQDDNQEKEKDDNQDDDELAPSEFKLPPHEYGSYLAVYYSNRAACLLHESRYQESIQDCDIAILLNPNYTKAYIRRMTAYEHTDQSEEALKDAITARELDPSNKEIQKHITRLQKIEDERMQKLKEETMGKLKDLGNSILGNFGLSLDNFKAQQDPNTGSYSISFNQK